MNIYQKLIEVRKEVDFLQKDTQGYQYKYVSGTSLLSAIRPKMDELGLFLKTNIVEYKQERFQWQGKDQKGIEKTFIQFVTTIKMEMTWVNAEKLDEEIKTHWASSGEDEDPAKANGKAHTYGERYYGLKFFNVPTDNEDPDAHQKKLEKSKEIKVTPQPHIERQAMTTLKDRVVGTGVAKFGNADKFKIWRVDNKLVENLDKATDTELNHTLNLLREHKSK